MPPSGDDPNPWYFGNEMTIDGCQGWRPSASASSANGSTKNPGKPPASDRQPPPDDPNATTGTCRRRSTRKHRNNPWAPNDNRNTFQSLKDETFGTGEYTFCNGAPSQRPSLVLSRGCQVGSFPAEVIPGQDLPRSMPHQLDNTLLEAYYASMTTDSPTVPIQEQKLKPQITPLSTSSHQGTNDPLESRTQRGPNVQDRAITKQNARDMKDPTAEYRQFDRNQDHEEDAETDEEPFQDQRLNGESGREN